MAEYLSEDKIHEYVTNSESGDELSLVTPNKLE